MEMGSLLLSKGARVDEKRLGLTQHKSTQYSTTFSLYPLSLLCFWDRSRVGFVVVVVVVVGVGVGVVFVLVFLSSSFVFWPFGLFYFVFVSYLALALV